MKKTFRILSSAFVLLCGVLVLASCNNHKHVVKEDSWVRDANSHWHACEGCDELFNYDLHAYGAYTKDSKECKQSRTCTVCGYVQTTTVAHTFADWGSREDGSFGKECTHCHHVEYLAQYYVRGSFDAGWAALDDYKLVINAATMSATVTVTLEKGTKFKVATGDWGKEFNGGTIIAAEGLFAGTGDIEVLTTGEYTFVVTGLDGEAKCTATFKAVVNEPTVEEPTTGDEPTADAPVTGDEPTTEVPTTGEETQNPVTPPTTEGEETQDPVTPPTTEGEETQEPTEEVAVPLGDTYVVVGSEKHEVMYSYVYPITGGTPFPALNALVYLEENDTFDVADSSFSLVEQAEYVEGLFEVVEGKLKIKEDGYYLIYIRNYQEDRTEANCVIELGYKTVGIDEAYASEANVGVSITGTIESITGDTTVVTDGTKKINVYKMPHAHVGDSVVINGVTSAYNGTPQIKNPIIAYSETDDVNKFDATLTKVTSLDQLADGVELVITYQNYVLGNNSSSGKFRENLYSPDHLDAHQTVVKLVKNDNYWNLEVEEGKYLYYNGGNYIYTGFAKTNEEGSVGYTEGQEDWTITISEGVLKITNVSSGRCIQYNTSNPRFSCYDGAQQDIEAYIIIKNIAKVWEEVWSFDPTIDLVANGETSEVKNKLNSTDLDNYFEVAGTVETREKKTSGSEVFNQVYAIELKKEKQGILSFTATVDTQIILTIGSSKGTNESYFGVLCDNEYVLGESESENITAHSDGYYKVYGTDYENTVITFTLEAGKTYTFAAITGEDSTISSRNVRVTSIVVKQ